MDFPVYRFSSAFVYHCECKRKSEKEGRPGREAIFILFLGDCNVPRCISRWNSALIVVAVMNALRYHCNDICTSAI